MLTSKLCIPLEKFANTYNASRKGASFFAQSCHLSRSHSSEMKHCRRDTPVLVSKLALFQILSRRYFLQLFCIHWTSHLHLNWRILIDRWMKFCRRYFIEQYAKQIIRHESFVCDHNCKKIFNQNTDKLSILLNYYKLLSTLFWNYYSIENSLFNT